LKQLLLIRHGKSSWRDPALTDLNRPLKKRGLRDASEMAGRIEGLPLVLDVILLSPARRVIETLDQMTAENGFGEGLGSILPELYTFSYEDIIFTLRDLKDQQAVAVVGHNPAITDLVNFLCLESISNIPTCGVALIDLDIDLWRDTRAGCGSLAYYDYPKNSDPVD
jgi:phosphohistidine phosphatase